MKRRRGVSSVLVIGTLLVVAVIVFLIKRPANPSAIVNNSTVQNSPGTSPTSGWETYTTNKYKFSFNYPKEWQLLPLNEEALYTTLSVFNYNTTEIEKYMNHGVLDIEKYGESLVKVEIAPLLTTFPTKTVLPNGREVTVNNEQEYLKAEETKSQNEKVGSFKENPEIQIGSLKTYELALDARTSGADDNRLFIAFTNGMVIHAITRYTSYGQEKFEDSPHYATIKQILSTMKFHK